MIEELAAACPDQVKVVKIMVDNGGEAAMQYNAVSLPNLIFFKDGRPVDQLTSSTISRKAITDRFDKHLQEAGQA